VVRTSGRPDARIPGSRIFISRSNNKSNRIARSCALAIVLTGSGIVHAGADGKATETPARKAIGDKKLDGLKSRTLEASVQRNVNTMQMTNKATPDLFALL
jgi:hypothetical protein